MKIAVVGLAPSRELAPWGDASWQKWCLAWDVENRYRADRVFEMHDESTVEPEILEMLAGDGVLITPRNYPFDAIESGDYFQSSVAYMLALAIHEGAEEIALYGVDMDPGGAYGYQKANGEYLIGFARGRGIKVHLPEGCPLCAYANPAGFEFAGRYGRLA